MYEMNKNMILLVEDEVFIAMKEIQELKKCGYHIIHAESGEKAIELVRNQSEQIGLILMDIDLGESRDGTQIAEEILKVYDIPILFLSSRTEPDIVKKTERITSYGYVVKNSGITVLDASIKMAFKLYAANKTNQLQKEQLGTILYSIGDAVIATDNSGVIILMNPVAEFLTGYPYEEAKGKILNKVFKIFNSITRESCKNPVELVLAAGSIVGLANHTVLVSKLGKEYQIADSGSPIKDVDGKITGVVLVFRDVTAEYEIQRKIEESEKRFRTLFEQAAVGVAEIETLTGTFLAVNRRYAEIVGLTEDEMLTTNFQSITHPEDLEADLKNMNLLVNGAIREYSIEKRYIKKNDSIVWVLLTVSPFWQKGELPTHHIAIVQDITERKLAEKQIQKLGHLYSTLGKINQSVITARDPSNFYNSICSESIKQGEFLLAWVGLINFETGFIKPVASAGNDFGYIDSLHINTRDAVTGMGPTSSAIKSGKIVFSNDIKTDGRMFVWRKEATDRGFCSSVAIPFKLKDKVIGTFNLYSSVSSFFSTPEEMELLEKIGDNISFALYMIDVESERRKVEETLRKNEVLILNLLKEKENLLKEIHHRIKNNMSTVSSLLTMQADAQVNLDTKNIIHDAASRVQSMMVLYDKLYRAENESEVSIREYFPALIEEIARLFVQSEFVEIEIDLEDIILNAKLLSSLGILLNELITNSMKYAFVGRSEGKIKVTAFKEQDLMIIVFEDTGIGIPEAITLKSSTGFGLQLVNILIRQIHGSVTLERSNGTRFTIRFPI